MRGSQRRGHLHRNFQRCVRFYPTARDRRAQSHAFNKFHRDELPVALRADLINRENVWMILSRGTPRFIFKADQLRLVYGQIVGKQLERSFAAESLIPREINFAHSADADK